MNNSYLYYLLLNFIFLVFQTSVNAQEQMTFYEGKPCCYYIYDFVDFEGNALLIARDEQLSVEIFSLEEEKAELMYSTHTSDKTYLLDQGRTIGHYYWVYTDRVELFSFKDLGLKIYEYPTVFELSDFLNANNAFHFTPFGMLITPEFNGDPLRFFRFETGKIDTLQSSVDRSEYLIPLDSFIFFANVQRENVALLSHNVVTDKITKVYTSTSKDFYFSREGRTMFFKDDNKFLITQGNLFSTRELFEAQAGFDRYRVFTSDSSLSILTTNKNKASFIQYDLEGMLKDSISFDALTDRILSFETTDENDLIYRDLQSSLFHFDRSMDSVIRLNTVEYGRYLILDSIMYFMQNEKLFKYEIGSNNTELISELSGLGFYYTLEVKRDEKLYFANNFGDGSSEVMLYDMAKDVQSQIISFGHHSDGHSYIRPQKTGEYLLAVDLNDIPDKVFHRDRFIEFQGISPVSPLIEYRGRYYIIGNDRRLYEMKDALTFQPVIDDLPIDSSIYNELMVNNNNLYTVYDRPFSESSHLVHLDVDQQTWKNLLPADTFLYAQYLPRSSNDNIFIYRVFKNNEIRELWRYDSNSNEWLKLLDQIEDVIFDFGSRPKVIGQYFYFLMSSASGPCLFVIDIQSGAMSSLTDFNANSEDGLAFLFESCGENALYYYHSRSQDLSSIWVSDGSVEGTYEIEMHNKSRGYMIPYSFEGKIYFTKADSFFTTTFQYDCEFKELAEVDWNPYFITQGLYKVGNNTFTILNHRFPRQNLSVAELFQDQINIIKEAPLSIGFAGNTYSGAITRATPTFPINDSILAIVAPLDLKGNELWFLNGDGKIERVTDLNEGRFDSGIEYLEVYGEYIYFNGYKYGPGKQIWRIPLPDGTTSLLTPLDHGRNLWVFPNPAQNHINIQALPQQEGIINILDAKGKIRKSVLKPALHERFSLDIEDLPSGFYLIHFYSSEGVEEGASFMKVR